MNFEEHVDIPLDDTTPPIIAQATARGWQAGFFNFGKAENKGFEFFNPGIVRRPDGRWLIVRSSELVQGMPYGKNRIWACKLLDDNVSIGGPTLRFKDSANDEQFEDPRAVYWNGQTWIACVNFTWFPNGSWTGAHIMLGVFKDQSDGVNITEESWAPIARRDPPVGTNMAQKGHTQGKHNKNCLFWFHEDKLHCLYKSDPWEVVEFGSKWEEQTHHNSEGVKWKYGVVRGGTPPILVGDKYFTFFHSSLPWRGRFRRYYMGALAFEAKAPFQPVLWTHEPLLVGSQNDHWGQRKPLVVFPCGALFENDKWFVTLGVNDLKSAWIEIPHEDLLKTLNPLPVLPGLSLLADQTPKPEFEPIPFEQFPQGEPLSAKNNEMVAAETSPKIDLRPRDKESVEEWAARIEKIQAALPPKKFRGRPRKDGLPSGSVPPKPRKHRKRRKRKALKSKA